MFLIDNDYENTLNGYRVITSVSDGNASDISQGNFVTRVFNIVNVIADKVHLNHILNNKKNCIVLVFKLN